MVTRLDRAKKWPRRRSGEILFNTTHEAIVFAHLIFDNKAMVDEVEKCLYGAREELRIMRQRKKPNLDRLMEIAVKAQMFRECLEEVMSIIVEE